MHCINVMTGALAHGTDTGATILIGGKRTLKIGDLMGTVVVPFMPLKTDEDYEALVELAPEGDRLLRRERAGARAHRRDDRTHRPGQLPRRHRLEIDANMVSTPRTNPYVRTDGWDDEVAKINAKAAA
jgi:sulfite reductase alpha subunit